MNSSRVLSAALIVAVYCCVASAAEPASIARVLEPGKKLTDPRLGPQRTLNDKFHPWKPATSLSEWKKQSQEIRERVLVSAGLWPMPPKEPINPVIHGRISRGDYTVEKIFFASLPGHYVSGNLYRPAKINGKIPGILCPHGHWPNGRFHDAGEKEAESQIKQGAETTMSGARYPLQARMVQLVRLGCTVFHYDMVGMADSQSIGHAAGFTDAEAELRLQSALGLQTFNSIRALDFLLSLPEVDPERIGVTGSSGGGTQTFMLCAVDPRPSVAFPAVMVSTAMQGGCVCENADLLRIGINNVAIAALFAPKPLAMSGANDWTIDIETKGLPELKEVYSLFDSADKVNAKCFPQFGHNYNRVAREMMYNWFNAHLGLGNAEPVVEQDFSPIDPKDLSVFDEDHPRPSDSKTAAELRRYITEVADKQFEDLLPKNAAGLVKYAEVVGTAAKVILDPGVLKPDAVQSTMTSRQTIEPGLTLHKGVLERKNDGSQIPYVALDPDNFNGTGLVWIDGVGKSHLFGDDGKPNAHVRKLLEVGIAVASVDLFLTGESTDSAQASPMQSVNPKYAGYTFTYNRPLLSQRVRDTIASIAVVLAEENLRTIILAGTGDAGPPVLLAAPILRDVVHHVLADARGLRFEKITQSSDPMFLPGALKYGGLGGLAALAAPLKLTVAGTAGIPEKELRPLRTVYKDAKGSLTIESAPLTSATVVQRLLGE